MDRRDFLKKSAAIGLSGAATMTLGLNNPLWAATPAQNSNPFDLVAIKGGEPDTMFDEGMKALGSMRKFVKPNQKVVIKPNIGWDVTPLRGADTNPKLVAQIVKHCLDAGAKEVYVMDHTADVWTKCYKNSGIQRAAEDAGAKMVPANNKRYYHEVEIPDGKRLKKELVHELALDTDVLINVPALKHHISTKMALGMKNMMGIIWDRMYWHSNDLHQCIADFATFMPATLTVVDGYRILKRNGPMGVSDADSIVAKTQIISADPVAADAASTKIFGKNPADVGYIKHAHNAQIGTMDLSTLNIKRIKV